MKITISIQADNAAFEGTDGAELSRILRDLADKVERQGFGGELQIPIRDVNGNKVGGMLATKD